MRFTYFHDNRLLTGLYKQETEMRRRKDERCIKKQTDIDRHGTVTTSTTLQIILDLCIPEKELAKTSSQISFI